MDELSQIQGLNDTHSVGDAYWDGGIRQERMRQSAMEQAMAVAVTRYLHQEPYIAASPAILGKWDLSRFKVRKIIRELPREYVDHYELLKPIPVEFEEVGPSAVIACFPEAELSVTGYDIHDAEVDLASWIFDMYEDLSTVDPSTLGKIPLKQRRVLQEHLRHRK